MKKVIAVLLALTLALGLSACARRQEEAESKPEPEQEPVSWDYEVTTETATDSYAAQDGTTLMTWSDERPVLTARSDGGAAEPPQAVQAVCDAFNDGTSARAAASRAEYERLKASALEQYEQMKEEGYAETFMPYEEETAVGEVYRGGDLLSVTMLGYGYWGGVHGGAWVRYENFDLQNGKYFTLNDMSDDPAMLRAAVADIILTQIDAQGVEEGGYFPEYEETLRAKEEFNAGFGAEGITVVFDQYELAPYAAGMPTFDISYEELAPYLNDYGAALLGRTA